MDPMQQLATDLATLWTCTPAEAADEMKRTLDIERPVKRAAVHPTRWQQWRIRRLHQRGKTLKAQRIILGALGA